VPASPGGGREILMSGGGACPVVGKGVLEAQGSPGEYGSRSGAVGDVRWGSPMESAGAIREGCGVSEVKTDGDRA
jgi:hypothetical protein